MKEIVWILPIIFMFHDLEEIVFMERWIQRLNKEQSFFIRHPKISTKVLNSFKGFRTDSFAFSVSIIYVILIFCTLLAYFYKFYLLWFSIFCVFTIHLFIHCFQAIILKSYIPALVTSIICIPICILIIKIVSSYINYNALSITISILITSLVSIVFLIILSKIRKKFNSKI